MNTTVSDFEVIQSEVREGEKHCLYCSRTIGRKHKHDCQRIRRTNIYRVYLHGSEIGRYHVDDCAGWDISMCEFGKNESSSCLDNIFHVGVLTYPARETLLAEIGGQEALDEEERECLCGYVKLLIMRMGKETFRKAHA